jgi:hypothetical protein
MPAALLTEGWTQAATGHDLSLARRRVVSCLGALLVPLLQVRYQRGWLHRRRACGRRSYLTPASAARRRLRPGPFPQGRAFVLHARAYSQPCGLASNKSDSSSAPINRLRPSPRLGERIGVGYRAALKRPAHLLERVARAEAPLPAPGRGRGLGDVRGAGEPSPGGWSSGRGRSAQVSARGSP